ncbi:MAG: hypothetical protein EDM75_12055, partial [Chlorobiota bacterium]
MKRYLSVLFPLLLLSFLSTGCLDYTQEGEIRRDGSGSMTIRYSFPPGSVQGRELAQRFDTATIRKDFTFEGYTIKKISSEMKEGDQWSAEMEIEFKTVTDLNA